VAELMLKFESNNLTTSYDVFVELENIHS